MAPFQEWVLAVITPMEGGDIHLVDGVRGCYGTVSLPKQKRLGDLLRVSLTRILLGLALDTIVAMDVVLADGRYVHVTQSSYPDLYYALRGAADSIGIVTAFHLQTQPAPLQVVSYSADFSSSLPSADAAASIILKLQSFVTSSPLVDRNLTLEVYASILGNFSVRGWYFGDMDHFNKTLLPTMLEGMLAPDSITVQERAWLTALEDIADGEPLVEPLTGYDNHQTFYSKSVVTREAQPLTKAALTSYFRYIIDTGFKASFPWETYISLYGGKDSQINRPAAQSAAYSHRDSLWVFQVRVNALRPRTDTDNSEEHRLQRKPPASFPL